MENCTEETIEKIKLSEIDKKAKPFLKWAGGKRQLLDIFDKIFPKGFKRFYEPMVGGGAVFFHLETNKAIINDSNKDLIRTYQVVRDNLVKLIEKLKKLKKRHKEKFYYQKRDQFNSLKLQEEITKKEKIKLAALFIYLNRTCFNGLYRVNQKGEFNVPIGSYKNPRVCNEENLIAVNKKLQNTKILCQDFEKAVDSVKTDDFVYFDPPYDPINETSNFTQYTNGGFGKKGQKRLAKTFKELDKKGAKVALSNSNTDFINDLYQKFNIHTLKAKRSINSNGDDRGKIKEVLVTNF